MKLGNKESIYFQFLKTRKSCKSSHKSKPRESNVSKSFSLYLGKLSGKSFDFRDRFTEIYISDCSILKSP